MKIFYEMNYFTGNNRICILRYEIFLNIYFYINRLVTFVEDSMISFW